MTALAPHRDAPIRRRDRAPWSPRAWSQVLYLTGGIPALLTAPLIVLLPCWALFTPSWGDLLGRPHWGKLSPLVLLCLAAAFLAMPLLARIHRHRLRATAGVVIPPQPIMPNEPSVTAIRTMLRSPATWRQAGYHLLVAPALAVAATTAFAMWLAGFLYTLVYAYAWTLPGRALLARGQSSGPPGHLAPMSNIPADVY
ncbi:MAG: sensor domain-containing protein, partial [Streptosporangiaceae bacterium]